MQDDFAVNEIQQVGVDVFEGGYSFLASIFLTSLSVNVLSLIVGFLLMYGVLRLLDKAVGLNFRERVRGMDDTSLAIYLGARILAFAILVGLGLS